MKDEVLERISSKKNLQVALDFISLDDAIRVAKMAIEGGVDIVEVGTPLVKAEGIRGIKQLREVAKDKILLADTKTADAGDVEVEIAKLGNADIMTVLGIMSDSTIKSAVDKAKELGIVVQADLINVNDPVKRAKRLKELGVDIIGLHVGLDVQKERGITVTSLKNEIKQISEFSLVSVAGGLNEKNIVDLLDLPINIYVVGGAITRSSDPLLVTKRLINIIGGHK
ncbi:orotidine 5'-phosphate decarboxylase / HUMPS family protein [Acidianus ambivalens]|uniref:D-arabino 3-hexulose 6-phosphate aldehyde lyase n=1 Tax=Acidianus ambivalens TaxID=2283 RepID=A0A650CXH0_ACIAM|nr:orotidine 5'-phosphate decarboxylase / HUMPS family protein [Acidianus ambivalens]MQL54588.1 D-arabino 3-hexulose 6-phosphate aldehyde lyase [Acidianus ambivalens]QGR22395.1 D-arabino 3-hexulose 6-phosphate aldehyde lyase [Acidianus ambivalens]